MCGISLYRISLLRLQCLFEAIWKVLIFWILSFCKLPNIGAWEKICPHLNSGHTEPQNARNERKTPHLLGQYRKRVPILAYQHPFFSVSIWFWTFHTAFVPMKTLIYWRLLIVFLLGTHTPCVFFIALQIGERLSSFLTGFDKDIMADRTVK